MVYHDIDKTHNIIVKLTKQGDTYQDQQSDKQMNNSQQQSFFQDATTN
jgi:hypothetical protein